MAASIQEFGWRQPIVCDVEDVIVIGHLRLEAAKHLALREVPVHVAADLSPAQIKALRIADNRTHDEAEWIDELVGTELLDLKDLDFDLALTGLDEKEINAMVDSAGGGTTEDNPGPLIDNAAKLQEKWQTAPGQLWVMGKHRLLCGDSTVEGDVAKLMQGKRALLFATDPPYLVAYDGTNHPHKWNETEEIKRRKNKDWSDKYTDVDSPEMGEALYDAFVSVAVKVAITENAAWYCWHASRKQALLEAVWEKHGAFVHQQIIWAKDRPILTRSWYMWQHEPCFFGWVKGNRPKRIADDYPPSVWSFPTHAAGETTDHPTQKPVELFAIPMRQHTRQGDLCYEPFSGSGTQFVAAEQLGRVCYGMEKSPPFVAVALERMSLLGLTPKLADEPAGEVSIKKAAEPEEPGGDLQAVCSDDQEATR